MNNIGKRLKNRGTLLAIIAWLYSVLELGGVIHLSPDNYELLIVGGVNILVLLGIVNDPTTNNKGYSDDK